MKHASKFRLTALSTLAFAGLLALPSPLPAQQASVTDVQVTTTTSTATVTPAPAAGPRDVQAGISRQTTEGAIAAPMPAATSRNVAWMIVGGAALVVGSIVGGDGGTIIMVTGAVIGLIGLFRYLQ
jgi:hypothetical protein